MPQPKPTPFRRDLSLAVDCALLVSPARRRRVLARKARLISQRTGENPRELTRALFSFLPKEAA
jgi:hypothetical protein